MKNKMILVLILLCGSLSHSGIRTVGNGGGLGEMKALIFFQKMDHVVKSYLNINSNQLSFQEIEILKKMIADHSLELKKGNLVFDIFENKSTKFKTNPDIGSDIIINSSALASKEGVPLSASIIGGIVLECLLSRQIDPLSSSDLSQKVFHNFSEESKGLEFHTTQNNFFHVISFKSGNDLDSELIFENAEESIQLTSIFSQDLVCSSHPNWVPVNFFWTVPGKIAQLDLVWDCGMKKGGSASVFIEVLSLQNLDFSGFAFDIVNPK